MFRTYFKRPFSPLQSYVPFCSYCKHNNFSSTEVHWLWICFYESFYTSFVRVRNVSLLSAKVLHAFGITPNLPFKSCFEILSPSSHFLFFPFFLKSSTAGFGNLRFFASAMSFSLWHSQSSCALWGNFLKNFFPLHSLMQFYAVKNVLISSHILAVCLIQ